MWPAEHCEGIAILSLTGGVDFPSPAQQTLRLNVMIKMVRTCLTVWFRTLKN